MMRTPTEWWQDLSIGDQVLYTTVTGSALGAIGGAFTTERPIVGILIGGLIGFAVSGTGLSLYYGYRTVTAPSRLLDKIT